MKTHQLILLSTVLFVTIFYGEDLGLNLGILGIFYAVLALITSPEKRRDPIFLVLFATTVFSSMAFAWFGDFASLLAIFTSAFLLAFHTKNHGLHNILVIPLFTLNFITFPYRFLQFEQWLPQSNITEGFKNVLAVVLIPLLLIVAFVGVYALGSEHFSSVFLDFKFEFNFWQFFVLGALGLFLAFNFWNFEIPQFFHSLNHHLKNEFSSEPKNTRPAFPFLDLNTEVRSGIISFTALNVLLLIFIITFNYEQFVEISKTPSQLSAETHNRVYAVIVSVVMAVLVIMFYFKKGLNVDRNSKYLITLTKTWIFLNAVLILSAAAKNAEYVLNLGFTYKRLAVFAFLILSIIGLLITFLKIINQMTNAYIFNHMVWYFYGTILVSSFFNWGAFLTSQNLSKRNFDLPYHLKSVNFNQKQLLEFAKKTGDEKLTQELQKKIADEKRKTFLSKIIYYQKFN